MSIIKDSGWLNLANAANDSANGGTNAWINLSNALVIGSGGGASFNGGSGLMQYLKVTGLVSPPSSLVPASEIIGIVSRWESSGDNNSTLESHNRLYLNGSFQGTNYADNGDYWPLSGWGYHKGDVGGATDLWGNSGILGEDVLASDFGFGVAEQHTAGGIAQIRSVQMRIYYVDPQDFFLAL